MKKFLAIIAACLAVTASQAQVYSVTSSESESSTGKLYAGEVNLGGSVGGKVKIGETTCDLTTGGMFLETIHGVRITKYGFVGLGFGIHAYTSGDNFKFNRNDEVYESDSDVNFGAFPLFVNLKGVYPINDKLKAYVGTSLGYAWTTCEEIYINRYNWPEWGDFQHGFYGTVEAGIQWKKLNVALGLTHQTLKADKKYNYEFLKEDMKINQFSLKIGLCW